MNSRIFIAIGANLPSAAGPPRVTCERALATLERRGVKVLRRSSWYRSAPVPASDQPWFVNGVAEVSTSLEAPALLVLLHEVEDEFGRVRTGPNGARTLDLDLLAYGTLVRDTAPVLPHPRLQDRSFVLEPLAEVAPDWRHPVLGLTATELLGRLPAEATSAVSISRLEPAGDWS